MDMVAFIARAREEVVKYSNEYVSLPDGERREIKLDDVYVVRQSKTPSNFKALLSTTLPDGMYYEVSLKVDQKEICFDVYKKFHNARLGV